MLKLRVIVTLPFIKYHSYMGPKILTGPVSFCMLNILGGRDYDDYDDYAQFCPHVSCCRISQSTWRRNMQATWCTDEHQGSNADLRGPVTFFPMVGHGLSVSVTQCHMQKYAIDGKTTHGYHTLKSIQRHGYARLLALEKSHCHRYQDDQSFGKLQDPISLDQFNEFCQKMIGSVSVETIFNF